MVTNSAGSAALTGLERFESLADRLRMAALSATVLPWNESRSYFTLPLCVVAPVPASNLNCVLAMTQQESDTRAVVLYRSTAPHYVAGLESIINIINSSHGAEVTPESLEQAMAAPWGDRITKWFWDGWDPQTGQRRERPEGSPWLDQWIPLPKPGVPAKGSRWLDIPRNNLMSSTPGQWVTADDGYRIGRMRAIVNHEGTRVARFSRAEDATFTALARDVISVFGSAIESVSTLCDTNPSAHFEPSTVLNTITNSTPWPIARPAENHPQEGR